MRSIITGSPEPPEVGPINANQITFLTIEGNIGAGKSTLMKNLKMCFPPGDPDVVFIEEPVQEWLDAGILQQLYEKKISAGSFQHAALSSLVAYARSAILAAPKGTKLFIAERSVGSNLNVFAQAAISDFLERRVFEYSAAKMVGTLPVNLVYKHVILQTYPETCMERVRKRDRASESAITMPYLQQIHDLHNDWIAKDATDEEAPEWLFIDAAEETPRVFSEAMVHVMGLLGRLHSWQGHWVASS